MLYGGRVHKASAIESGSIPGRLKPNTIKIGIQSFLDGRSTLKGTASIESGRQVAA